MGAEQIVTGLAVVQRQMRIFKNDDFRRRIDEVDLFDDFVVVSLRINQHEVYALAGVLALIFAF